jgi:hypothetical protein
MVADLQFHVIILKEKVASPRASEPNTASDFTPRWRKSAWWRLSNAETVFRFMVLFRFLH